FGIIVQHLFNPMLITQIFELDDEIGFLTAFRYLFDRLSIPTKDLFDLILRHVGQGFDGIGTDILDGRVSVSTESKYGGDYGFLPLFLSTFRFDCMEEIVC